VRPERAGAPIHRSLVEPVLLMGMERSLAQMVFIAAAVCLSGAVGFHWWTIATGVGLLTIAPVGLVQLAKYDPDFERVFWRWLKYQRVYEAEAARGAKPPRFDKRPAVPGLYRWL